MLQAANTFILYTSAQKASKHELSRSRCRSITTSQGGAPEHRDLRREKEPFRSSGKCAADAAGADEASTLQPHPITPDQCPQSFLRQLVIAPSAGRSPLFRKSTNATCKTNDLWGGSSIGGPAVERGIARRGAAIRAWSPGGEIASCGAYMWWCLMSLNLACPAQDRQQPLLTSFDSRLSSQSSFARHVRETAQDL